MSSLASFALEDHIPEVRRLVQEVAQAAREAEAEEVRADAEARSVRGLTGDFAGGWKTESEPAKHHVWVYNDAKDAAYNEYGTMHRPPAPALGPATHAAEARWPARLSEHLRAVLAPFEGL